MLMFMLQARRTECDAQLARDFIDEKECEEKKQAAWFWYVTITLSHGYQYIKTPLHALAHVISTQFHYRITTMYF